tara:strand:+ start:149 stop:1960 length:1812 start_codon:yes stop_codon:yes gene_type:complete
MAEYKTIKGFKTQSYATDPVASQFAGGTWASGTSLTVGIGQNACMGIATAALSAFGDLDTPVTANAYEFDGTTWTAGGTGTTARRNLGAAGIQTAALAIAGQTPGGTSAVTEAYNGTAWTAGGDIPSGRQGIGGAGTTTAAIAFGGGTGAGVATADTYNGSSWTAAPSLNQARDNVGGGGATAPDAMCVGGNSTTNTEKFNGSAWTEVGTLNNARNEAGVSMQGVSTSFLTFGGSASPGKYTEHFNGTTWTTVAELATGRSTRGCGIGDSALCVGGANHPGGAHGTNVEEWSAPAVINKLNEGQIWYNTTGKALKYTGVAAGTWASGGTMNSDYKYSGGYCGTQDAGVYAGGIPGDVTTTQTYNGTAWAASPATLNVGRHYMSSTGIGIQTAAMLFGGELASPPHDSDSSEEFDGSAWTATPAINTARMSIAGAGTATAGLGFTGGLDGGGTSNKTESWNGSTWTEVSNHNESIKYTMGGGTQTSAIRAGGVPAPLEATSSQWDGTSWSSDATINTGRSDGSRGAGSGTAALIFSGNDAPSRGAVESFNGTAWTTENSLGTSRGSASGSGTSSVAICAGGSPPNTGLTEEWATSLTVKTVTVS